MIKILILTDRITRWYYTILNMMEIDSTIRKKNILKCVTSYSFHIRSGFPDLDVEQLMHVILDKQLDEKTFYEILMPTIKQRITNHGLDELLIIDKNINL